MRGNSKIEYKQLGLDYTLTSADILYNRCLVHCYMGDFTKALEDCTLLSKNEAEASAISMLRTIIQREQVAGQMFDS